jgi:phage tail sheath gpL-like
MPSNPKVSLPIIPPQSLAGVTDHRVLIVGQKTASGSAVSGALVPNIGASGEEDALFGQSAHISGLIREFRRINGDSALDAIALDDAGGAVQGTGVFTITGPATEDGRLVFSAVSDKQHSYDVDVLDTDTATDIGDALAALITADGNAPFTAANVAGVVTLTAENGGTLSNDYAIKVSGSVAGVAVALTGWSGGATDPVTSTLFDPVQNVRYNTILYPASFDIADAQAFIDTRFNVVNDIKDGVVVVHLTDTLANLKIASQSVTNSESIRVAGTKFVNRAELIGGSVVEANDILAARFAAVRSLRLTADTDISDIMSVAGAPNDVIGGVHISTLPYFNTLLPNTALPELTDVFSETEEKELVDAGISTLGLNDANNAVILGTQVSTYLTDNAGNPDGTYHFLNAVDSSTILREFFWANDKKRYAQTRLTDGDLKPGFSMQNETSIRAFQKTLYVELSEEVITQAGSAAVRDFENGLTVVVDVPNQQATINMAPLQVGQLRVVVGAITVNFGG